MPTAALINGSTVTNIVVIDVESLKPIEIGRILKASQATELVHVDETTGQPHIGLTFNAETKTFEQPQVVTDEAVAG